MLPTWNIRFQISREAANVHAHASNSKIHLQTNVTITSRPASAPRQ
jgi:hypothetical protein